MPALAVDVGAQTEVLPGVTRGKDYGIVYTLPKTEISVTVRAQQISYRPGEFSRYADQYLRLSNVSGTAEEHWELTDILVETVGVPDKERTYFVKLKDKTVAPLIELTEEGLIRSINVPLGERTPVVRKPATEVVETPKKRVNPRDFFSQEILMANSSAKMAELVAQEIYAIRESRSALVRGQAETMPTDGEQLRLMLDNLHTQEQALLSLFAGVRDTITHVYTYQIVPDAAFADRILLRFSRKLGVLSADDLAGAPVYATLTDLHSVAPPATAVADGKAKKELMGVAYNVPGRAELSVEYDNRQIFQSEMLITQFGIQEYLAPELFNKKSTIQVYFNPESGSLRKVEQKAEQ
ncbi:MAG: DUF4831 family protein [Prevotellaceae bacterium]|nr:DUF4831 family protein [Prevotellaceae bacterium]